MRTSAAVSLAAERVPELSDTKERTIEHNARSPVLLFGLLLLNLFVIRYLKPLLPLFVVFNFALIDGALLLFVATRKSLPSHDWLPAVAVTLLLVVPVVALNLGIHGVTLAAIGNLLTLFAPLVILIFVGTVRVSQSEVFGQRFLASTRKLLNIHFVVNTPLVAYQALTGRVIPAEFLAVNPARFDHAAGLIGMNGVGVLNFVWLATLAANLWFALRFTKVHSLLLASGQFAVMWWISGHNDNKMFLETHVAILGMGLLLYRSNRCGSTRTPLLRVAALMLVCAVAGLGVLVGQGINSDAVTTRAVRPPPEIVFDPSSPPSQNDERAYINYLAYSRYDGGAWGSGLANVRAGDPAIHRHLGINSATLLLIQGGIPLLLSVTALYAAVGSVAMRGAGAKRPVDFIVQFLTFLIAAYATRPYDDHYLMIAIALTFLFLGSQGRGSLDEVEPLTPMQTFAARD